MVKLTDPSILCNQYSKKMQCVSIQLYYVFYIYPKKCCENIFNQLDLGNARTEKRTMDVLTK